MNNEPHSIFFPTVDHMMAHSEKNFFWTRPYIFWLYFSNRRLSSLSGSVSLPTGKTLWVPPFSTRRSCHWRSSVRSVTVHYGAVVRSLPSKIFSMFGCNVLNRHFILFWKQILISVFYEWTSWWTPFIRTKFCNPPHFLPCGDLTSESTQFRKKVDRTKVITSKYPNLANHF